uniref:DUF4283 domain-containing protein n=1 Tax=Quercus lobata TaxID=97700 RepID=A0A7N2LVW3_QUELO
MDSEIVDRIQRMQLTMDEDETITGRTSIEKKGDPGRILLEFNRPWCFDNQILVLRRWEKGMTARSVTFTHMPIWVQVWGLPFDLITEEAAHDIGQGLGKVIEVDCKALKTDQARFLRIKVEVPLENH